MSLPLVFTVFALCLGCSKPVEQGEAKHEPAKETTTRAVVPATLSVAVERNGLVLRTITAKTLNDAAPDFEGTESQAWRLDRLLNEDEFPSGAVLEAIGEDGVGISMRRPPNKGSGPLPVLVLTRRGEIVAAAIRADDPFPEYHGQGGRQHRPGDPTPRLLTPVSMLRISATTFASLKTLQLKIGEAPAAKVSSQLLAAIPSTTIKGDTGQPRQRLNVRDLVMAAAGEGARLTKVVGESQAKISEERWGDLGYRPVLHVNRRGQPKFLWFDSAGAEVEEGSVRGVLLLEMTR